MFLLKYFATILFAIQSTAASHVVISERCTENNLTPSQVKPRNSWGRKCFGSNSKILSQINALEPMNFYVLAHHPATNNWVAPLNENASCDGWVYKALCLASCFTPEQLVLFENGYKPIAEATAELVDSIVTLSGDSLIGDLRFKNTPIESYSRSWQDGNEKIYEIKTDSGKTLRVTSGHPILKYDGQMVKAMDLTIGDSLISARGQKETVTHIGLSDYFGKVYNVSPDSGDPKENIIVAQGLLNGSAKYQYVEAFASLMYRKILRENIQIPEGDE